MLVFSLQVGPRSGLIIRMKSTTHPPTPPNLKFATMTWNQVRTGELRTGQVGTSQDRTSQVRTGQVETGQVTTGQVGTNQVRTGQHWTGQVGTGKSSQEKLLIYSFLDTTAFLLTDIKM